MAEITWLVAAGILVAGSVPLVVALRHAHREAHQGIRALHAFHHALGPAVTELQRDAEATHETARRLLAR